MSLPNPDTVENSSTQPRLQKVLAHAGVASRRACEELISTGRVKVNGITVTRLGTRVNPATDVIHVDEQRLVLDTTLEYWALHKPRGVVSAMSDDRGRRTLADLASITDERIFHIGRLDVDSEGLLLLTNHGELAHRLMHPSYGVSKTYICQVTGLLTPKTSQLLRKGVMLDDGVAIADAVRIVQSTRSHSMVELVVHSGRKHIVRRMLAAVGHPVERLVRTQFGPIRLRDLAPGSVRALTRPEVGQLYQAVNL